jgi:hypothetical protein
MSSRDKIKIVIGSDELYWWTLEENPTAASYHGTRGDSRGFKHRSEAEVAASFAADEADRETE